MRVRRELEEMVDAPLVRRVRVATPLAVLHLGNTEIAGDSAVLRVVLPCARALLTLEALLESALELHGQADALGFPRKPREGGTN